MNKKIILKSLEQTFWGFLLVPFPLYFFIPSFLINRSANDLMYDSIFSACLTFSIYFYMFNRIEKRKIRLLDTFLNEKISTEDTGPR
jgi:hypothetical protein